MVQKVRFSVSRVNLQLRQSQKHRSPANDVLHCLDGSHYLACMKKVRRPMIFHLKWHPKDIHMGPPP
jgi:hypothetical protein